MYNKEDEFKEQILKDILKFNEGDEMMPFNELYYYLSNGEREYYHIHIDEPYALEFCELIKYKMGVSRTIRNKYVNFVRDKKINEILK